MVIAGEVVIEAEVVIACGLWLPVELPELKTKELSELSELGLGAEVSTFPEDTSHLVVDRFWV